MLDRSENNKLQEHLQKVVNIQSFYDFRDDEERKIKKKINFNFNHFFRLIKRLLSLRLILKKQKVNFMKFV